jgi:hypothetical protein
MGRMISLKRVESIKIRPSFFYSITVDARTMVNAAKVGVLVKVDREAKVVFGNPQLRECTPIYS